MPRVFLSYSRADLSQVERLHAALQKQGIDVWRDQEDLYGGQSWPKELGEAVAGQDVFLLCWSARTQNSTFVELEWTTALALQKPIIPCLLDETPLPASLRAFHGISVSEVNAAASTIAKAIQRAGVTPPAEERPEVLRELESIGEGGDPAHVLDEVKTAFDRQGWLVHGNIIQVDGGATIHVGDHGASKPKGLLEKWQTWVTVLAASLALFGTTFDLWERIGLMFGGSGAGPHVVSLMPGIGLGQNLPKPRDQPETTYSLKIFAGDDTVSIADFRRRLYLTGASERSLKDVITQAAESGIHEGLDAYLQENQIPIDHPFRLSMLSEPEVHPSVSFEDAEIGAEMYRHQPGASPTRLRIHPIIRHGIPNVTTVIIEGEQP